MVERSLRSPLPTYNGQAVVVCGHGVPCDRGRIQMLMLVDEGDDGQEQRKETIRYVEERL